MTADAPEKPRRHVRACVKVALYTVAFALLALAIATGWIGIPQRLGLFQARRALERKDIAALGRLTTNADWKVRLRAVQFLGRLGDEAALPVMLDRLADSPDLERAVFAGLRQIGSRRCLTVLVRFLERESGIEPIYELRELTADSFGYTAVGRPAPERILAIQRWREWVRGGATNGAPEASDETLRQFLTSAELTTLNVYRSRITDDGLAQLRGLRELKSLNLASTTISDKGLAHLAHLPGLTELDLSSTPVTGAALRKLAQLPQLSVLVLSNTGVNDEGLASVGQLRRLRELDLYNCRGITNAGIAHLASLDSLRSLDLSYTLITDDASATLARLPALETLWLTGTGITDRGVRELGSAPSLAALGLWRCKRVTDDGLRHLRKLRTLRDLYVSPVAAIGAGTGELQAANPELSLYR